jgi:hypothetical protein
MKRRVARHQPGWLTALTLAVVASVALGLWSDSRIGPGCTAHGDRTAWLLPAVAGLATAIWAVLAVRAKLRPLVLIAGCVGTFLLTSASLSVVLLETGAVHGCFS